MIEVAQARQLMKQALEILDATGAHQSAAMLDSAIYALPALGHGGDRRDRDTAFAFGEAARLS